MQPQTSDVNSNAPIAFANEKQLRRTLTLITQETNIKDRQTVLQIPSREADQLTNFSTKAQWSDGNKHTILKLIHESLVKSDDKTKQRLLRLLPSKVLKKVLTEWTLKKSEIRTVLPLIGVILQTTDEHNLLLLMYLSSEQVRSLFSTQILANCSPYLLKALLRCLQAQPMLAEPTAWDFSPLFKTPWQSPQDPEAQVYLHHLRRLICPEVFTNSEETVEKTKERINLVSALFFNKTEEKRLRITDLTTDDEAQDEVLTQFNSVVNTKYLSRKAEAILDRMDEQPFGHVCISGPQGSGKMSLLTLSNELYTERHGVKAGMIVVTLEASFDSKNLVGTYVCNETGDFQFKKGPLTVAAEQGMWLVLRNIEETPSDLLSFLLPLIQENILQVTSSMVIRPKLGFRLCFLQKTSASEDSYQIQHEDIKPLTDLLYKAQVESLVGKQTRVDFTEILVQKFPALFVQINEQGLSISDLLNSSAEFLTDQLNKLKPHLLDFRQPTVTQLLALYKRVDHHFAHLTKQTSLQPISQSQRQLIIEEIADVYTAYMYDTPLRTKLINQLVLTQFNPRFDSMLDADAVSEYCTKMSREHGISQEACFFGRVQIQRTTIEEPTSQKNFVYTSATLRLLEQITTSIEMRETVLLVGETGTGKTTAVQEIARVSGREMHVFNLNQNTDSADLLGGFKPVDLKYLLKPIYENFLSLFLGLFTKTPNNQKFLDLTQRCYENSKVKEFCQCMQHGMTSIKSKRDLSLQAQTLQLEGQVRDLQKRTKKLESQGGFIFQFVEGTLIKSMQNGDWVLLDEINLASESILNKLATIIQGNHVLLNERADVIDLKVHPDFRVFMCMNPPYSSAGKKQLPQSLRCKLSEYYVPELDNQSDLWSIIDRYSKSSQQQSCVNEENKRTILQFYVQVKLLVSKQTKRGNIGLRNLCRALRFMNAAIQLKYPVVKAIYDSLFACFASHLDAQMQDMVKALIFQLFKIKKVPTMTATMAQNNDGRFAQVEDSLILLGKHKPLNFDENEFVLTPSFSQLVHQLAAVISVSDFAVILEGPTSAGKTSCINYLAKVTHNHVIRINNHMHTDVQEYLGSYVPDAVTGKLGFQEGILVEAVRKGYWVILDELNLAPSEVLEALNRLLDDNRELHIVETQKVIKAHPQFRIFATQNPTEGYGGRKELSEAFKNRFVMIKVRDVPTEELKQILELKCNLPASRASLMVKVMENLQIYRSQASIFSGKDSCITVRDLLKWAGRINSNSHLGTHVDMEVIALEGFLVLAERSRDFKDKTYIKETIEKVFGCKLAINDFYESFFETHLLQIFSSVPKELNLPPIILSRQIKRLAVLVYKCLMNKEPVLLVGETGCGKTTLCQVFANAVTQQQLFAINCHQNTETSDFIGCMRTRKTLNQIQDQLSVLLESEPLTEEQSLQAKTLTLKKRAAFVFQITQNAQITTMLEDLSCVFEWTDGILVNAMQQGGLLLIDEISLANDSVLERLNSVFEHDRTLVISEKSAAEAVRVVADDKFNMVATMNPGSDFGKKELSPALRNRMTEIWVDSYFTQSELVSLYASSKQSAQSIITEVPSSVDLHLIISDLCHAQLQSHQPQIASGIFNLICFVNFTLSERYFSMQRKALSIRDILMMIDFIVTNTKPSQYTTSPLQVAQAFKNAVELVIIDGLCLGIDIAGEAEKQKITNDCYQYLSHVVETLFTAPSSKEVVVQDAQHSQLEDSFINTVAHIGVSPFVMAKQAAMLSQSTFAFDAQTTKINLKKLLRAFSLGKPVLVEGSPGVGKTSLVENLAKQTGKKLIRVNLSDQTDMMDLLGSEYPVPNADDDSDIQFSWCDGVLLQAIREGHWFLIDEMNLAQQSILEGLNAILDHRRTVYIPELNQEFVCHPDFFVFACQNPSQSSGSTSGRKTLPKSFLNRFAKIYLEDLTTDDYQVILNHQASDVFSQTQVDSLLQMTQKINARQNSAIVDKQAVNMRDLSRFLKLYRHFTGFSVNGPSEGSLCTQNAAIATALETCYGDYKLGMECGGLVLPETQMPVTALVRASQSHIQFESLHLTRLGSQSSLNYNQIDYFEFTDFQDLKGKHAKTIQALCDCLHANLPVLVITNDSQRFSRALAVLAKLSKTALKRILLNDRSDTTQLLGCFEQTSNDLNTVLLQIVQSKSQHQLTSQIAKLQFDVSHAIQDDEKLRFINEFVNANQTQFGHLQQKLKLLQAGTSKFEWVDSVLVQAVTSGHWVAIENANLCNPSILDRLNGLFEEGTSSLPINEQGLVNGQLREAPKHVDFRAVFVVTEKTLYDQGKDVSKALKNRCLELNLHYEEEQMSEYDILNSSRISTEVASINTQLVKLQREHDLLPCLQNQKVEVIETSQRLGKRQSPEPYAQVLSLKQLERPVLVDQIREPYPFYLPLLESGQVTAFADYLKAQIAKLQSILKDKQQSQILENQLSRYLNVLLNTDASECVSSSLVDLYCLLNELSKVRQLREITTDAFLIYEQSKSLLDNTLTVPTDFQFIQQPVDFALLQYVQKPDQALIQNLKFWLDHQPQNTAEIYCYKLPNNYIQVNCQNTSRFATIIKLLKFNGATLILIDAEKEIHTRDDKLIKHLEDTCFDVGAILQTPNLVIVPKSLQEGLVVVSQSFLYESLCYIKDLMKLSSCKVGRMEHFRMTRIPALLRYLSSESDLAIVVRQISLQVLERSYFEDKPYQLKLMKAVLFDEQSIALKDLPAAYAASHSLLCKLQKIASEQGKESVQELCFEKLADKALGEDVDIELQEQLTNQFKQTQANLTQAQQAKCLKSVNLLSRAFAHLEHLKTSEIIRAMFILPLELKRQSLTIELAKDEIAAETFFWQYHLRDTEQPEHLLEPKSKHLQKLQQDLETLSQLSPSGASEEYYSQNNLRHTLQFITILTEELLRLRSNLLLGTSEAQQISSLAIMVSKQFDSIQFATVSNILQELMLCVATVLQSCTQIVHQTNQVPVSLQTLVGLNFNGTHSQFLISLYKAGQTSLPKEKHELNMKWILKQQRLSTKNPKLQSAILEHFIQREVIKRMLAEEQSALKFTLPFKMWDQKMDKVPVGKAMDEWTKEDKAKMEQEAEKDIELNFPSYFDEVQKAYYAGDFTKDTARQFGGEEKEGHEIVSMDQVLAELLELSPCDEPIYRANYLTDRLSVIESALQSASGNLQGYTEWVDDVQAQLNHALHEQKLKQVMNITDVQLAASYNFYHSPLPQECKLIYQPLMQLQMRLRDISIRDEYESPLLNESLFLANYMLACFNIEVTPLMKLLTCMEFLLSKLEEWENTYASKRLNSVENEINSLKLLVIRYRKIQILSWRNLLNWKQDLLVRDDFVNSVRLAHTVTKQVFEGSEDVLKILDLCDLYVRDSTLGTFKPRLQFISVLKDHLLVKQSLVVKMSEKMSARLQKSINALEFVFTYYNQFKPKLQATIARLDSQAREKVKTLIDIKKWTLQKFTIMKDNVDKTHRQLNKACKGEEEILIQNVQSLVLDSSRKKFGGQNDQLLSLDPDNSAAKKITCRQIEKPQLNFSVVKQLHFLESSKILPNWPSCLNLQESIDIFMERLEEVRAMNKKYLQKKAFYDLLRYMKDEGLRPNFQTELQALIVDCKQHTPYFVKAYETYVMLKVSVQSEEVTDLKSTDVLRCQGFSQHLLHRILEQTLTLQSIKEIASSLDFIPSPEAQSLLASASAPAPDSAEDVVIVEDEPDLEQFCLTDLTCKQLKRSLKQLQDLLISLHQQLSVQYQMQSDLKKREEFRSILRCLEQGSSELPLAITNVTSTDTVMKIVRRAKAAMEVTIVVSWSQREKRMLAHAHAQIEVQEMNLLSYIGQHGDISPVLQKRQSALESQVKVFYQEMLKMVDKVSQKQDPTTLHRDSFDNSTTAGKPQEMNDQPIFTIEEKLEYSKELQQLFSTHLPTISQTGSKIIQMVGVSESQSVKSISQSVAVLQKVKQMALYLCQMEAVYLDSMAKFSYMTQRVFLYLIYQGFCGLEEEDDPDVEPPSDLERDGMGMGDGNGGDDNVADQIEHEEQLEGLKNYESEDEKPKEEPEDKKDNKDDDEESNDFEMKEDFDGEMDDDQKSQNSNKKSDEDDENDQVDDMLDNELWNQNMEDMEEQEKKDEKEEQERREQDLGERELQDENIMEQESDMAEGDHDKDEKEKKEPKDQEEVKDNDQEMAEEDQPEDEGSRQESDEEQDIGLNQEAMPADNSEEFSEESKEPEGEDDKMGEDSEAEKGSDESEVDSQFEEKDQNEMSEDGAEEDGDEKDDDLDVKNDVNQAVLEDDQIEANEQNKDKDDQANLKKQKEDQKVDPSNNNQQQDKKPDQVDSQQVDPNGSDMLFNFAQQLQQKEQNKKPADEENKPEAKKPDEPKAKEVQDPNMVDKDRPVPEQPNEQDDLADEYMHDDNAQQMEGKLAADKTQDKAHEDEDAPMDEEQMPADQEPEDEAKAPEDIEMTQQEAQKLTKQQNLNVKDKGKEEETKDQPEDVDMDQEISQEDLIQKYNDYLEMKQQTFDLTNQQEEQEENPENTGAGTRIIQNLDQFDYLQQKQAIRQMFAKWQENPEQHQQSLDLLAKFKNQTQQVTSSLCEQLRIVLEPQLSQNLQGDFKTGKRLNMKKVISFIASNYRNDKIWLRRTLPSKRDYKILIAIDDSLSMKEANLGFFSLEASVALGEALQRLEVGKVAVARIRDRLELVQSFEDNYSSERAAHIVSAFDFKHCGKTSADTSMANFVSDANKLLDIQNTSNSGLSCPFVIVLSDGRFNKDNVRRYMREAKEKRYLYIFVVLDKKAEGVSLKKGQPDQSIMSMRSAVKQPNGAIKLDSYMKDFPFDYYCVVSDTSQLPSALGTILVQWFSMVSNNSN